MKLIVFYSFYEEDIFCENYVLVNTPENLKKSEFKDYVQSVYFDKILALEENCNNGTIHNFGIDKVEFIKEL